MRDVFLCGDAFPVLSSIPGDSVQCCITSPPYYGLRDYDGEQQIGDETHPEQFLENLVNVFREVKRILKKDGVLWVNLGDSYAAERGGSLQPAETISGGKGGKTTDGYSVNRGRNAGYNPTRFASRIGYKHKDLMGLPWKLAFALQADGWYLRQDIIWQKNNPAPESVQDRCTKSHEYLFLLAKSEKYFFDNASIKENSLSRQGEKRNKRSVWTTNTSIGVKGHSATFPESLIEPCVLSSSKVGDIILDPFMGAGTTAICAKRNKRHFIGVELNPCYHKISVARLQQFESSTDLFGDMRRE